MSMRHSRHRLALTVLALLGLLRVLAGAPVAQASCMVTTPAQRLAWSSVVFRGQVTHIDPEPRTPHDVYFGPQQVTFTADTAWKGAVTRVMVVTNPRGTADLRFQRGAAYLVYATGDRPSSVQTNACLETRPIPEADDDLRFLGPGGSPDDAALPGLPHTGGAVAGARPWWIASSGLIVAMLLGLGRWWRCRATQVVARPKS